MQRDTEEEEEEEEQNKRKKSHAEIISWLAPGYRARVRFV